MTTLEQAIQGYIEKRSYRRINSEKITPGNVEGLFIGKRPKDKNGEAQKPNPYALMQQDGISGYLDMDIRNQEIIKVLQLAIMESVKAYPNKKPKVVKIYQDFITYLEIGYGARIPMDFPYLYANEFDRQMFIVKELHKKCRGISDLEDRLWTSSKTIGEDLKDLQTPGAVRILDQNVTIRGIDKADGVIEFESTVHPIFLTATVEQVIALLEGLRVVSMNTAFKRHVLPLVSAIWNELSGYGKRRVIELIENLQLEREWYEQLPNLEGNELFWNEVQCSSDEYAGNVLDFLKNKKTCTITYLDDGKECYLSHVTIDGMDRTDIIALKDGLPYRIDIDSIIRTTRDH